MIEAVLADFRAWLTEASVPTSAPPHPPEPPDLHTLLGQMTALRHEVNLQTKAARAQQEQNAQTLSSLQQALQSLNKPTPPLMPGPGEEEILRPVLKVLLDIADALILAQREFQRGRDAVEAALVATTPAAPVSLLDRLFRRPTSRLAGENPERIKPMLESLVTGYRMSLQRVERALEQLGVQRIECVGRPFDPERMEAVELVEAKGTPGQIVDEVRPGYLWRGSVFRFAQVRVSRKSDS